MPKILGLGLFVTAILLAIAGATSPAEFSTYLVAKRDLTAGIKLQRSDFETIQLVSSTNLQPYEITIDQVIGKQLQVNIQAAELIATNALQIGQPSRQELTVSFDQRWLPPDLNRGDLVDLWVIAQDAAGNASDLARLAISRLVIATVSTDKSIGAEAAITFYLDSGQVSEMLNATAFGRSYLVRH